MDDPTSIMWPVFEGRTCLPPGYNVTDSCSLGGYPSYAVNITNVAQIQLAINFARNLNLRLVVKNTGHDFSGKSAGAGALSIWTHHLKSIELIPEYQDSTYSGPAIKLGAGIQAFEVYEFANANNVSAVGGEGKTVGVAGGYVLGGGHSPLGSVHGLAADQVLALEVVLPDGTFTTVTAETNPDLFWALRGGGGSTFGVVTSIVSKVYPKIGASVAKFTFGTSDSVSPDAFFEALGIYYSYFDAFTAAGTYVYFWVLALGDDQYVFEFNPFFAVNHTVDQFNTLIQPLVDDLSALNITLTPDATYYDNFYDAWIDGFPLETVGTVVQLTGSRLFPRENFVNATLRNETLAVHRATLEAGFPILAFQMKADAPEGTVENAANPAFRQMLMHAITSANWDDNSTNTEIISAINNLTYNTLGPWRAVCPESGAYMSEADVLEPNFQQAFYGTNYPRLYALKQQYDPYSVFYAPTAVGSENWTLSSADGLPDQNGRLCRVQS
jgi:FAD binding domain/Berberine and berberine like